MKHLPLLLLCPFVLCGFARSNDAGEALLKQIDAVKPPAWDSKHQGDKKWMDEYMAARARYSKTRNSLILKLYKADPDNPKTPALMEERWRQFESGNIGDGEAYTRRVLADIAEVLKSHPKEPYLEIALASRIEAKSEAYEFDMMPDIREFLVKYPTSERAATLLMMQANRAKEADRGPVFKEFLEHFPNHKYASMVRGGLRRIDGIGKPFELKFTDPIYGKQYDVAKMKGKVVVIDFWATWCGPCVAKMPELIALYKEKHAEGLEVIGVSLDQPEKDGGLKALKEFVAKNSVPYPVYYQGKGWESGFSTGWGIMFIPTVFVVDKQGSLRLTGARDVKAEVEKLLKE